jgi:hypothetical protein
MEPMNFHRLRGSVKALSVAIGASGVIAMGALTVAHSGNDIDASTASTNGWGAATITRTPPPSAPQTSFAAPPVIAGDPGPAPCPKRGVYPC